MKLTSHMQRNIDGGILQMLNNGLQEFSIYVQYPLTQRVMCKAVNTYIFRVGHSNVVEALPHPNFMNKVIIQMKETQS